MADYGDILLNAVKTVVDGTVSGLQFDKTVVCNITKNTNAAKGEYTVSDGSTTFLAYSDNTEYTVGQSVYVNIPNGDYSKQKMITGKYMSSSGDYYTYTSPWKNFVDITGDLVADDSSANSASILANGTIDDENYGKDKLEEVLLATYKVEDGKDYTCVGLKADFKAFLSDLGAEYGTYGLRLYIRTVSKTLGGTNKYQTTKAELSTLDMYGNPYSFETYYTQEKVFDVSGLGEICSVSLYLFQKNDFYDANNNEVIHERDGVVMDPNIFVNNIYLAIGYSVEDFDGDMVVLYTRNPDTYSSAYGRDSSENTKLLQARWVHKKDDDSIVAYTSADALGETARVHWYKYKLDNNISDELAGSFWEEISEWQDTFEQQIDCFDYISEQEIKYKIIIESPVKEYLLRDMPHNADVNNATQKLEAAEWALENAQGAYDLNGTDENAAALETAQTELEEAQDNYNSVTEVYTADVGLFESNELTLTNEQQVADLATIDLIQSLTLSVDADGYKGVYTLYDQTNQIQDAPEANKMRSIIANYNSTLTGDTDLDAAESITWMIPLSNTMIHTPEDGKEFDSSIDEVSETTDGQFMIIKRDGTAHTGSIGTSFANAAEQLFRIKDYYTESATNNIITCYVIKNQKTYEASADLSFGPMGTNGTDFTFVLSMESDRTCVFKNDHDPIQINAALYDYTNAEVPHAQNATITYSWYSEDDVSKIGFCTVNGDLYDSNGKVFTEIEKIVEDGKVTGAKVLYEGSTTTQEISGLKLLRDYVPSVDTSDTHMYCYIRRLTDYEIQTINKISLADFTTESNIPFYYILKASLTINANSEKKALGQTMLGTYLPIPYSGDYDFTQISGTTKIVYNSSGTSPYYYKEPYKLYSYSDPVEGVTWDEKNAAESIGERKYYPAIDDDGTIVPASNYVQDLSTQIAAVAYKDMDVLNTDEYGNVSVVLENGSPKKESTIVWTQPILVIQDAYSSAMLNAWDGSLSIDEENKTIMSQMVGAGYKDKENRYNGILMGKVDSTADTGAGTGLFGYSEGVQSFGFKIDGTAFIGKSGKGQIQFDGNSGIIQSMSYKTGQSGMKIDLDDGILEMRGNEVEKVRNIKNVEVVEVTDFSSNINDILCLIDGEKITDTTLQSEINEAIQILNSYNGKKVSEMTAAQVEEASNALDFIRSTVDQIQFKESILAEYLENRNTELQNDISDNILSIAKYQDEILACCTNNKSVAEAKKFQSNIEKELQDGILSDERLDELIASCEKSLAKADKKDIEKCLAYIKKIKETNEELQQQLKELQNYADVKSDIATYIEAQNKKKAYETALKDYSVLVEKDKDYTTQLQALQSEVNSDKTGTVDVEVASLLTLTNQAKTNMENAKTTSENNANTESKEYYKALYDNAVDEYNQLNQKYKDLTEYQESLSALITKYQTEQATNTTEMEKYSKAYKDGDNVSGIDKSYNTAYLLSQYEKQLGSLKVSDLKTAVTKYTDIIDTESVIADLTAYYKSIGETHTITDDELSAALQKAYYYLLETTDEASILPTQLVNSTTVTPTYVTTRSKVRLATESPYFEVVDEDGYGLIEMADNVYWLQSSGYNDSTQIDGSGGKGVKFDLKEGSLKGYDFSFKSIVSAENTDKTNYPYNGSYVSIGSKGTETDPYMRVHYTYYTTDLHNNNPAYDINLLDITRSNFVMHSQNWIPDTQGMEFNLTKGTLKAFSGFNLKAVDDGNYIQLSSEGNPFFRIHYNGIDLMNVTKTSFVLQSQNWVSNTSGLQIDLTNGKIKAFDNFSLIAKIASGTLQGSYIQLSTTSSDFVFDVHYTNSDTGINGSDGKSQKQDIDLFKITKSKFYLQSRDWKLKDSNGNSLGLQIDMNTGKITAYKFTIKAYSSTNPKHYISIDSTGEPDDDDTVTTTYPLRVHGTDDFKVDWDGKVYTSYITATDGGEIGPFVITANSLYIGSDGLSAGSVYLGKAGVGVGKGKFTADSSTGDVSISGNCYITENCEISKNCVIHDDCLIDGNLTVSGTSHFTGQTNLESGSGSSGGTIGNSGYSGGTSGGDWGMDSSGEGHIGVWKFNKDKMYTDTGSELGSEGTIKLTNKSSTLKLKDDGTFSISSDSGHFKVTDEGLFCEYGDMFLRLSTTGYVNMGVDSTHYFQVGSDEIKMVFKTSSYISVDGSNIRLCANNKTNYMDLSDGNLEIDGLTCEKNQTIWIGKLFNSKTKLVFHKGLLVNTNLDSTSGDDDDDFNIDGDLTVAGAATIKGTLSAKNPNNNKVEALGKLAWKDAVTVSSANFKIGSSALTVTGSNVDGATATYTVTIPGQAYSAGSSGTAYAYAWLDKDDVLHVTCTTESAPSDYNDSTNKAHTMASCSAGSGGNGTTDARTLTAKVTVSAT